MTSDRTVKREDYISWDEYFMGVARLTAERSKDPNSQVGACIVSADHRILSMGYNGFPAGCSDDDYPWAREGDELSVKYTYVTHAELNAILNFRGGMSSLAGAGLYVTLFPCNECAKAIIQTGIKTVVYGSDKYADTPSTVASKKMFDSAGVKYRKYEPSGRKVSIDL
ncbi:MAG: dCMP deaminase family protein [Lachnospiraceae bacterium]|nr:dCMP deaminase family protein [Lachnospiraceae bacterium]